MQVQLASGQDLQRADLAWLRSPLLGSDAQAGCRACPSAGKSLRHKPAVLYPAACLQFRTLPVMNSKPGETHEALAPCVLALPAH